MSSGIGLVSRGISGFCPVNAAVGRNTATEDTRRALGGSRGVNVASAVTIDRPVQEMFAFWRQLSNLPRCLSHVRQVTEELGGGRSHWVVGGPMGASVEWDAEIIRETPNELISWKSVGSPDVVSAGSVRFRPAPGGRGTEIRVNLQYAPPAGKIGARLASLFGEEPSQQIHEDLRRLKQQFEAGEISTGARVRSDRATPPADSVPSFKPIRQGAW